MTGFGGRAFEFMGQPNKVYSLLSENFHKVGAHPSYHLHLAQPLWQDCVSALQISHQLILSACNGALMSHKIVCACVSLLFAAACLRSTISNYFQAHFATLL